MADVIVKYEIKRKTVRKSGNKEVSQRFATYERTIEASEANIVILQAILEGYVEAVDGQTE